MDCANERIYVHTLLLSLPSNILFNEIETVSAGGKLLRSLPILLAHTNVYSVLQSSGVLRVHTLHIHFAEVSLICSLLGTLPKFRKTSVSLQREGR